jgi:hypothetical protein
VATAPAPSFSRDQQPASVPLWRESLFGLDWLALRASPVFYGIGVPRGDGSAVVLVNYTYEPVDALTVELKLDKPVTRATSTEGVEVKLEKTEDGVRLQLPLKWADIVVLE